MASTFTFTILEPVGFVGSDILFLGEDADGEPATFPVGWPEARPIVEALLAGVTVEALVLAGHLAVPGWLTAGTGR